MKNLSFSIVAFCLLCVAPSIKIIAQTPHAAFTANFTKGCTPLVIQFTDQSTNNPTQWSWNLGNGTTSTEQNPSTVFITPGTYEVTLTASNAQGSNTVVKAAYITVYAKPVVAFSSSVTSGCLPLAVQFTDNSTAGSGTISQELWDFGDGFTGNGSNPLHTYTLSNSFSVALTVTNSFGCATTLQKPSYINIAPAVNADFDYTYVNACQPPTQVTFHNLSSSLSTLTYQWLFGDGRNSTNTNPVYTYNQNGNYNIQLIAKSDQGCVDTVSKSISIGSVIPNFIVPQGICVNEGADFTNSSTPAPQSATWDFGDGNTASTINAANTYTKAGTYPVKMTADFGSCNASVTKNITVTDKPKASFKVGNISSSGCGIPTTVTFINTSNGAVTYKWFFGDGGNSTDGNPTYIYTKGGFFSVTLIAFNSNGCSDTVTVNDLIKLGPPQITNFEGLPFQGCAPVTINFKADIITWDSIASYVWTFGDGTKSNQAQPSHTYTQAGSYNVKLVVTTVNGCVDSLAMQDAVKVGLKPNAGFKAVPNPVCGNTLVQFTDTTSGVVTNWQWYIGNVEFSTQQNPVHQFDDTGYVPITLIVADNGCYDTLTIPNCLYIFPPVARYNVIMNCSQPFVRTFKDSSIAPKSWLWDFGDGTTSTIQNPTHTFGATGMYAVTLTVKDSSCQASKSYNIYIVDEHPSFTYTPTDTAFCRNTAVTFKAINYTPAYISAFDWNFGDGVNTGFAPQYDSLSHSFAKAGRFSPALITRDINNCFDTIIKPIYFNIYGPTAAFTNPPGICLNGTEVFTDHSVSDGIHGIKKWIWNYGDSTSGSYSSPPFQHTYNTAGTYNVILTVIDTYGCEDSLLLRNDVQVTHPVAAFSLSDSIRCAQTNVSFQNQSTGNTLEYIWYSGDGRTFTTLNPTISYPNQGVYTVSLAVVDKFGCTDSIAKPNIITISNPHASFNLLDTFATCPPLVIAPQNISTDVTSQAWNFGDNNISVSQDPSHTYTESGTYQLKLVVQGYGNCYDSAFKTIVLKGPSGTLHYNPLTECAPAKINFSATTTNAAAYTWDLNNGVTKNTTDTSLVYTYNAYGNYLPKLILYDTSGCKVSVENTDTIKVADVKAALKFTPAPACDSSLTTFTNSSVAYNDSLKSYTWHFGDGTTSISKNPTHYYKTTGTYDVYLTAVTNQGCTNTDTIPAYIQVNKSPVISFQLADSTCVNNPVQFTATDKTKDTADLQWQWNLGNGIILNTQAAQSAYTSPGNYFVYLKAIDANGCHDSAAQNITIVGAPNVDAGLDTTICQGSSYTLNPSGANGYTWMNNPTLSCTTCSNPIAQPDSTTTYYVKGTINLGCSAKDSVIVQVKRPFVLSASALDTLCNGESTALQASGAEVYQWSPAEFLNNPNIQNPVFHATADTSITYTVIGRDNKNCFADTGFVKVKVYPVPQVQLTQKAVTINVGEFVQLNANSSPDVTQWRWSPPDGLSNSEIANPIATPNQTVTYTVVAANQGACIARDQVVITVLCNGSNIFVPNTFSPNNDGMNDVFYPRGKGLFSIKSLLIFNRWGQVVFQKNNFSANDASAGWDGTFNGQKAPSDVYVYIMQVVCGNSIIVPVKGNVALLR